MNLVTAAEVFGLYNEKTLIFNGRSNMGKSEFCMALAKEIATRKAMEAFGWGTIDKYGVVTRALQMHLLGFFVFDDFTLSTRGGTHTLTMEEVKHLLYVKQRGTVHAFYGDAIFPENIPRIWSINYKNVTHRTHWFERENHNGRLNGLIALAREDVAYFNANEADEEGVAVARRAIIFSVDRALFTQQSAMRYDELMRSAAHDEEERGTPMP